MSALTDAAIWADSLDLQGDTNQVSLQYDSEPKDDTTFGDGTRSMAGGLKAVAFGANGFWDAEPDATLFTQVGLDDVPISVSADRTVGNAAYLFLSTRGAYSYTGQVGELFGFQIDSVSRGDLVRGTLMIDASAVTSSSTGTGYQLGAVGAAQTLYASIHAPSVTGTLDVTIESDDNGAFSSAVTRITFAQLTDAGSEFATAAGAITDDYYRVNYTIGGSGTSTFAVTVGIL